MTDSYERTRELCHRKKLQRSASARASMSQSLASPHLSRSSTALAAASTAPLSARVSMCANASGALSRSPSLCTRSGLQTPALSRQQSVAVPIPGAPATPPERKLTAAHCVPSAITLPSVTPEALTRQASAADVELPASPGGKRAPMPPLDKELARTGSLSVSELSTVLTAKLADMLASPAATVKGGGTGAAPLAVDTPPPPNTPDGSPLASMGPDITLSPFVMRAPCAEPAAPVDTLPEDDSVTECLLRPLQRHKSLQRSMRMRAGLAHSEVPPPLHVQPLRGASVRKSLKAALARASAGAGAADTGDLAASGSLSGYSPSAVSSDLAAVWQVPQACTTPQASAELPRAESCATFAAKPTCVRGSNGAHLAKLPSLGCHM